MRHIYCFLSLQLIFGSWLSLSAQDQELFLRGNNHYHHAHYQDASACYQAIANKGHAVLYNNGNCCYHLNRLVDALVWWSRAEKNAQKNELSDIRANKASVYALLGMSVPDTVSFMHDVPFIYLQCIVLLCWFFVLLLFWYVRGRMRVIVFILGSILMIFLCTLIYTEYCSRVMMRGYIVTQNAAVYVGPGTAFQRRGSLPRATEVAVETQQDGWSVVRCGNIRGWISKDDVEVV